MAPLTETYKTNTERLRYPTQPPGKLVPACVEIDDEGNPVFSYHEATPQKPSPKILTPRNILNRLHKKRENSQQFDSSKHAATDTAGPVVHNHINNNIAPLLEAQTTECDENQQEDASIKSKESSLASTSNTSRSSFRFKGFRLNRKTKDRREEKPLKIKFHRRSSISSATKSCTSRTGVDDLSSLNIVENIDQLQEVPALDPETVESDLGSVIADAPVLTVSAPSPKQERPEPIATLKLAMEQLSPQEREHLNDRRMSDPLSTSSSRSIDKNRRSSMPAGLQQHRPKSRNHLTAVQAKASSNALQNHQKHPSSTKSSASTASITSRNPHYASFKIYMLLLHPSSKIFELIQLFFDPTTTTIRDVLNMVPANATEPALGEQVYTSLCRPDSEDQDEEDIADLDLLVQNFDNMKLSAMIVRGEILVAVPQGYTAHRVSMLSQQILVNPRIRRLLESADALGPKNKETKRRIRKTRRHRRGTLTGSPTGKEVEIMAPHNEGPVEEDAGADTSMMLVQKALENAASAAAAANAAIRDQKVPHHQGQSLLAAAGKEYRYPGGRGGTNERMMSPGTDTSTSLQSALHSLETYAEYPCVEGDSSYSLGSYSGRSTDNSFDNSYSSWSKSLDTSFAGTSVYSLRAGADTPVSQLTLNTTMMTAPASFSYPVANNTKRRTRQVRMMKRGLLGIVAVMFFTYLTDASGYASRQDRTEKAESQSLGMAGFIQVALIFLIFAKLQFLCNTEPISSPNYLKRRHRCPFMKTRAAVMASHAPSAFHHSFCQ